MQEIMIFKAGKYPQGEWPKERCKKMVDAYSSGEFAQAPLVIGHRYYGNDDAYQDAHGWVKSLRIDGNGKVFAEFEDVSAELKDKVAEKKLKYMSCEIWEFDKVDDTKPPALKSIALLGRDTPAVAGAKLPAFFSMGFASSASEDDHTATFTRKVAGDDIGVFSGEPESVHTDRTQFTEVNNMDELEKMKAETEKLRMDFAAQGAQVAALQKENAELKNAGKKAESEAYFSKLRDEGKITPAQFDNAIGIDSKLEGDAQKDFRAMFAAAAPQVDLSGNHAAPKSKAPPPRAETASLTAKIKAFQKEHKLATFEDAADAMYAEKPEAFAEEVGND